MKTWNDSLLQARIAQLIETIRKKGSLIVAFSGGVDSSVVAAVAQRALGDRSLAVTISSPLHPSGEAEEASRVAEQIGISSLVVGLNEFEIPGFSTNPPHRCYLCKSFRFRKLVEIAVERHFEAVADGTNASDLNEYRPGLKAREELGVYSPLLEAGLSKEDTRGIASILGLHSAGKVANPCLATRVPYGNKLTPARLRRIELAERWIKGVTSAKVVRVRDHDHLARIEVGRDERGLFFNERILGEVARKLKDLGYEFVTLDVEGYRSGSFDGKWLLGETPNRGAP